MDNTISERRRFWGTAKSRARAANEPGSSEYRRTGVRKFALAQDQPFHLDEQSTEATAAMAITVPKHIAAFRADHPFLFIRQEPPTAILFMGRCEKPAESWVTTNGS